MSESIGRGDEREMEGLVATIYAMPVTTETRLAASGYDMPLPSHRGNYTGGETQTEQALSNARGASESKYRRERPW